MSVVIDLQLRSVNCVLCLVFYMVCGLKMRSAPWGKRLQFNLANIICLRCEMWVHSRFVPNVILFLLAEFCHLVLNVLITINPLNNLYIMKTFQQYLFVWNAVFPHESQYLANCFVGSCFYSWYFNKWRISSVSLSCVKWLYLIKYLTNSCCYIPYSIFLQHFA